MALEYYTDYIRISDLKFHANHGVFDFEKENGQTFIVDADLYMDLQKAGLTDDLDASVNYAMVSETIQHTVTSCSHDLIEKVAETIAATLLNTFRLLDSVKITVSKPEAPMEQDFSNVAVSIFRKRHQAFIAYGSNIGDSTEIIKNALTDIEADNYCRILEKSSEIISTPYGDVPQDNFHNGVIMIETYYEPYALLDFLNKIEHKYGRERLIHWGPRTLDLDIILYDHLVLNTKKLTIPHIDMASRDFVLIPLSEIAPWYIHPVLGKSIQTMCQELSEKHVIK